MFFKRLKIEGFKSFGQKTEIRLVPGISVIVGPNGCGKSNVFDSIKWVLGEQSAKSLRGHRMADVVFAGSPSRKPSPHSEVTLEIGNEGGFLSTDETSLEITRRLFRTGESEYWMNGRPCRLREVQQLMMGTGVGTNSYAIMQQGKVDRIIHSRPQDRRYIIEEAAGISKYKVHKEEALRRLERTEEDLRRLSDLMAEVKGNAGKLRKQAERAREYKRLTEELRKHDMVLIARRYNEVMEERRRAETAHEELAGQMDDYDVRIQDLQTANESRREELEELAELLESSRVERELLGKERAEAGSRATFLRERLVEIAQRRERLEVEIETADENCDTHEGEREGLEKQIGALKISLREDDVDIERRGARLNTLKEGMSEEEEELIGLRESVDVMQADRMQLEAEVKFARQMLEKLADVAAADETLAGLDAESRERAKAAEEAREGVFRKQDEVERTQAESTQKKQSLKEAEAAMRDVAARREETLGALRTARSRLGALQQLQENHEGLAHGPRQVMLAADQNKLPGIIGPVATLLRPKQGMETAMEVALGGAAQNIVTETAQDAKAAIDLLKRKNAGRASFLPLDIIKGRSNDASFNKLMKLPGVVGWATDQVEFDPKIWPAVEHLLGATIVVEHLDVALAMERKGFRTKYVSLDGDILSPGGVMSGGSYKTSGLMTREAEIASLGETAESLARQLVGHDEQIDSLEATLGHLRISVGELGERLTRLQVELVGAIKDAEALDKDAKAAAVRAEAFRGEHEKAGDERANYEDQVTFNTDAIEDLGRQIAETKARMEDLSGRSSDRTRAVAEAADAVQELRVTMVRDRERLSGLEAALARLAGEAARQRAGADDRRAEATRLDDEEDRAREELAGLEARVAELEKRLKELDTHLKAQGDDRQSHAASLQKLAEDLQKLQRDRNLLQNELHEAEVKAAQQSAMIESLSMQASEKFESSLDDVVAQLEQELLGLSEQRGTDAPAAPDAADAADAADVPSIDDSSDPDTVHSVHVDHSVQSVAAAPTEMTSGQRARWLDHPLAQLPLESLQEAAHALRRKIEGLGPINLAAIEEHATIEQRLAFLAAQQKDLVGARNTILTTIAKIDETTSRMFRDCFDAVRGSFVDLYRRLFGGGKADLVLTEPDNILETGIDIIAQPPGKAPQTITLLSGGEMCLTAIALLFALFQWKPSPFCILDEIDAPLDDANVGRFKAMIREFAHTTQFIIITHNKLTMELADSIIGVTMQEPGVSKIVSVRFDQLDETDLLRDVAPGGVATPATPAKPSEPADDDHPAAEAG